MKRAEETYLDIDGRRVPIKIYREFRNNVRVSMGKKSVILRMPAIMNIIQQQQQIQWARTWVKEQMSKNEKLEKRYIPKNYKTGDTIQVGERRYTLHLSFTDQRKTHYGRLSDGVIFLELNPEDNPDHLKKSIKHLISRVVAQDFLPSVSRRVMELNQMYFKQPIKQVKLKYNRSNWGSCSTQGNINISTRLLFAPDDVIDYVIIHELAHRLEMNHSPRFWKLVSDAMPDYKSKEKWLKTHGDSCDF